MSYNMTLASTSPGNAAIYNTSAQSNLDETSAAWYIFTVVGFFGLVIFILLVSNLTGHKDEEDADPYFQYIERQSKKKEAIAKLSKAKLIIFGNKVKNVNPEDRKDQEFNVNPRSGPKDKQDEEQPQGHTAGEDSPNSIEVIS